MLTLDKKHLDLHLLSDICTGLRNGASCPENCPMQEICHKLFDFKKTKMNIFTQIVPLVKELKDEEITINFKY